MKCPQCGRNWLWDWCQDLFRLKTGQDCLYKVGKNTTSYDCLCRMRLGLLNLHSGEWSDEPLEWKDADWENPTNQYQEKEQTYD